MNLTRRKLVGWTIAAATLCLAWFLYCLFGPNPPIIVSRETTYITEPLDEDGLPDYEANWVKRASEGVTPDNNAAVPIWRALGANAWNQAQFRSICAGLGIEMPPRDDCLASPWSQQNREQLASWLSNRYPMPRTIEGEVWVNRLRDKTADEVIGEAGKVPWTSDQIPPLAKWVEENTRPLDLLIEGANCPFYFCPPPKGSDDEFLSFLLPDFSNARTSVYVLPLRAMHHLGEGRAAEAWQDMRACYLIAHLTSQHSPLVGQLTAIAVEGVACKATHVLLHHGKLTEQLARQILSDISSMPKVCNIPSSIAQEERFFFLDTALRLAKGELSLSDIDVLNMKSGSYAIEEYLKTTRVDWNAVLMNGNAWYDRAVTVSQLPTRRERQSEAYSLESVLTEENRKMQRLSAWPVSVVSRRRRSDMTTSMLLKVCSPYVKGTLNAEDRNSTWMQLTCVAAALTVYRAQHGEYPVDLSALAPDIFSELPLDLYSEKPFLYQLKSDGGYLLYSVFENGVDDGGTDLGGEIVNGEWIDEPQDVDMDKSDLVIRVPVPPFRLPKPPTGEEH